PRTVDVHLLVAEPANSRSRNGMQIFAVVPKLLMISSDDIHAVRRHELAQRLRGSPRVDGRPVIQISSDKNRVWLFLHNLRNHAPQTTAASHVSQVQLA